jgi:hypothetical protein
MSEIQELIDRLKATLPSRDDHEWADAAQYWCSELSMQDVIDTVAALERMHKALENIAAPQVGAVVASLTDQHQLGYWMGRAETYQETARRALNRG